MHEDSAGKLEGVVGLAIIWADLAEVRSLAMDPQRQGQGIGRYQTAGGIAPAARRGTYVQRR